jgi:hypothetical protein
MVQIHTHRIHGTRGHGKAIFHILLKKLVEKKWLMSA